MRVLFQYFTFALVTGSTVLGKIPNIPYGSHPRHILDLYLPIQENVLNDTRIILLIHGGGWGDGQKADMESFIPFLQVGLPGHYIANMEYRLGSVLSPAFPKQIEDINLAIQYLQSSFAQKITFALMGSSAGGHLAMLYSYWADIMWGNVKVVVSHVGPADLLDPNYTDNPDFNGVFMTLLGPCTFATCPEKFRDASPNIFVVPGVAPTIGFYGNADPLVPATQMPSLQSNLNAAGVINRFTMYEGGHGNWTLEDQLDMIEQFTDFLRDEWKV